MVTIPHNSSYIGNTTIPVTTTSKGKYRGSGSWQIIPTYLESRDQAYKIYPHVNKPFSDLSFIFCAKQNHCMNLSMFSALLLQYSTGIPEYILEIRENFLKVMYTGM